MKYITLLNRATVEKDVENAYRQAFVKHWPDADISSPHGTDGLIKHANIRLLCEAKYDHELKQRVAAMKVLGQLVFYMKHFEQAGELLPNVLFVGDINECFVIDAHKVIKYLSMDIDWDKAPSGSHPELEAKLIEDMDIAPFVYDVGFSVNFSDVVKKIEGIASGECPKNRASVQNIDILYGIWEDRIFKGNPDAKSRVASFLKCLFYPEDVYIHPKRKNILVVNRGAGIKLEIDVNAYRAFFNNFHQGYSPSEVDALLSIQDRILEETTRRMQGEYYTPAAWVEQAHKMLEVELGTNWKDNCFVIDVAAGIANLTVGYQFSNLILSTLKQEDVDVIQEQGYNQGAVVEQWDFLREFIPKSIEDKLKWAGENDVPVVWFSNPPYGTAANYGTSDKGSIAVSPVNERMKRANMGASASQQLYAQFMYQISGMTETYKLKSILAFYTIPKFLTGAGYGPFGDFWQSRWEYCDGILLPAGDFADTTQRWGISFTIWRSK